MWTRCLCIPANRVLKIRYLRTSTHNIRSYEGTHIAPTSIALIVSPLVSLMVDQKARLLPTTGYNINSLHLTIKTCGCEIITLTPCNERGRNQYCIAKLPDPFLCGVAQ